ncbi:hypothetical protein JKF63_03811 [Porcisia hertigi]|uniref:Uncharacterized protein n=1 Tax=Porcisia hertigi TaxID=2761500 RepID=A0A836HCG6_9TRYP|nr:hypothetical protein JKF63_03811 [Porcisia hertigi]
MVGHARTSPSLGVKKTSSTKPLFLVKPTVRCSSGTLRVLQTLSVIAVTLQVPCTRLTLSRSRVQLHCFWEDRIDKDVPLCIRKDGGGCAADVRSVVVVYLLANVGAAVGGIREALGGHGDAQLTPFCGGIEAVWRDVETRVVHRVVLDSRVRCHRGVGQARS